MDGRETLVWETRKGVHQVGVRLVDDLGRDPAGPQQLVGMAAVSRGGSRRVTAIMVVAISSMVICCSRPFTRCSNESGAACAAVAVLVETEPDKRTAIAAIPVESALRPMWMVIFRLPSDCGESLRARLAFLDHS
ncbi:hypothetical protein ACFQ1S_25795 [Kibdelosporangium lantanae]|uniref:Uncharacterized protein n=1 Tax=Kibdelosporangium lantanae TaxID=1497396 RepID=A0ABW3MHP5_9PSEU